jgi:hypothetical protein
VDITVLFAVVGMGNQAIDAAHQGGFSAAGGAGNQHHLTGLDFEIDILDGEIIPPAVSEGKVFDD